MCACSLVEPDLAVDYFLDDYVASGAGVRVCEWEDETD